jgi:hypothetical protein
VVTQLQFIIIIIIINVVSCHRPFLPGTSLEPVVIPTAQASSLLLLLLLLLLQILTIPDSNFAEFQNT